MATDALKRVKEAEAEADGLLETVQTEAAAVVRKAKEEAQSSANDRISAARTDAASAIGQAQKEGERMRAALVEAAESGAERLRQAASARMADAVKKLVKEMIR